MNNILDAFYKDLSQLFFALALLLFVLAFLMWLVRKTTRKNSELLCKIFWFCIGFGVLCLLVSIFMIINKADDEMQTFLDGLL